MFTLLLVVIGIALLFDLVNGFHDAANSIATVVSTKVLTPFQAVLWAAMFNIIAFWVFDMSVGNTVAKTVDNNAIDLWVILAGLLAATFWNLLTWWLGIPSSSSHTLIGGFAGAAVAHAGFGVIESGEILKVVLFIFLAPIIGGFIAYLIAVVTISRAFWKKMLVILLLSGVTIAVMEYMIEYIDMKPIMMYIIIGMIAVFILVYIWFELVHGSKPSAVKEANMHKKLQLLSSAAFSLGHGGADSQKVMGIICAALLVYGNMGREGKLENPVPKDLRITELMQIEFNDADGKKHKFKPEVAEVDGQIFYIDHKTVIDAATGTALYTEDGKAIETVQGAPAFKAIDKEMHKIEIFTFGAALCDAKTNDTIFLDKTLDTTYKYAGIFSEYVDGSTGELSKGHKIKTKVHSDTMPFWVAFGCYLMIGIGTLMGGWKIVKTMGTKITKVTPLEGVCAETAGALTLFTVSQFGIPVSTTHTITGSIIGVGATKRLSAVRWGVTINLLWAWILTIPVSAFLAAIFYHVIIWFK
ncbi:MAG: inorganic phosphate transporter [Crocinitomicaceae bacterium]|nr:inorganic phosphate transporter [Crocinitomicaceae bacterium]MDP4722677.1 inorganic phosphate transporter [Crocinitomicaceae bacterium]MDP4800015.1 inorganic phosphate transporter [Crocinitomicaceae bacterium]MDP4807226.1 inorganic phosphate transporter [Crocinitomicaceae bacterium]MDP4867586.1 inorganic phosphate transporter [Crocinitomicaceae bacterium]